jgi:programmed cell death protein 5
MASPQNNPGQDSQREDSERKAVRENVLRIALTSEARQRLANIRIVKPDIARAIEEYVIQVASSGKLKKPIDDDQLKEILGSLQEKKRDIKIRWV